MIVEPVRVRLTTTVIASQDGKEFVRKTPLPPDTEGTLMREQPTGGGTVCVEFDDGWKAFATLDQFRVIPDVKRTVKVFNKTVPAFNKTLNVFLWYDIPGAACLKHEIFSMETVNTLLASACPGCGRIGYISCKLGPKEKDSWQVVKGDLKDVTTLSLHPSIHCVGCCGWHGWLTDGVFKSV